MNLTPEKRKMLAKWIIGIGAACIVIFLGIQNINIVTDSLLWGVNLVLPLIIGAVLAMILNVPMHFFESHLFKKTKKESLKKLRTPLSFLISLILILGIVIGVIYLIIPALIQAITVIVQNVINIINEISAMSKEEIEMIPFGSFLLSIDWNELINGLQNFLKEQSGTIMDTAFGTIGGLIGGVSTFFVSFVFSIYFIFNKKTLCYQICRLTRAWLPEKAAEWSIHAVSLAGKNFRNFVAGQSTEAAILGTLSLTGMLILQIPYAPMVASLLGVTALIPVIGGFIGLLIGAFMIVTVDPLKALIFVVFLLILQQIEGNVIYPRIMGNRVNLPGMWILAAVTIGGSIGGPIGMLIGVPVFSTVYTLIKEATIKRENKKAKLQTE